MPSGKPNIPTKIIVHHTAVRRTVQPFQFMAVNNYHRDSPSFGAYCKSSLGYYGAYHYFIEADGSEFKYRNENEEGCHAYKQNLNSIGIALAGNFDLELPTNAQIATLRNRIRKTQERYDISNLDLFPHRKYANKSCYGSLLSDDWARNIMYVEPVIEDREKERAVVLKAQSDIVEELKQAILKLQILIAKLRGK